jgi:citrate lyase beta subunit
VALLDDAADILARLHAADAGHARRFAGDATQRRPIQTLYLGAQLVDPGMFASIASEARRVWDTYAPTAARLADALGWQDDDVAATVHARVADKLAREPLEDLRVDFEDGYGARPDREEDEAAEATARAFATALRCGDASPWMGIRIKGLGAATAARAIRTLDLCVSTIAREHGGIPPGWLITLPKVTSVEQVVALVELCARLEQRLGLGDGALRFEIMVEVPQTLFDAQGQFVLPLLVDAAQGRLYGMHLGVFDFTAACGIAAAHQALDHPLCDLARALMTLACAQTGVLVGAGSTHVLPVEPDVLTAWRTMHDHVRHALVRGHDQGWDLHAAQLPVRYAASYRFYLESHAAAAARLRTLLERARPNTSVQDDPATGQALLGFLQRGRACGALTDPQVLSAGLDPRELGEHSFARLHARRATGQLP